jgi:ketosteroid isomerase-like protein
MAEPVSGSGPRQVFERVLFELQNANMDAYANLFAEDGVFELPFAPPPLSRRIEGREAIRRFLSSAAERLSASPPHYNFSSVVVHETVDPEIIVTEYVVHGVAADGSYQFSNLGVMTVRNGEIVSLRDYWSPLDRPEFAAVTNSPARSA